MKSKLYYLVFSLIFLIVINSQAQESLSYIIIRTAPNGGGSEFGDHTMTADDSIALYCAAYDSADQYVADINADWVSTGSLDDPD
jgi:hypothetical protein